MTLAEAFKTYIKQILVEYKRYIENDTKLEEDSKRIRLNTATDFQNYLQNYPGEQEVKGIKSVRIYCPECGGVLFCCGEDSEKPEITIYRPLKDEECIGWCKPRCKFNSTIEANLHYNQ